MNLSHRPENSQDDSAPPPPVAISPEMARRKKTGLLQRQVPLMHNIEEAFFIWVCGQSMPSSESRGNSGGVQKQGGQEPQSHKKALHLILFYLLKGIR